MSFNFITVGIADIKTAASPDILRTVLGSCVAICLYDPVKKVGGLAHIMLPQDVSKSGVIGKYADTSIPFLIEKVCSIGAERKKLLAKITGGANMIKFVESSLIGQIGERNIESVKQFLKEMKIGIVAEDLRSDYARTIDFYLDTGIIKIKHRGKVVKTI